MHDGFESRLHQSQKLQHGHNAGHGPRPSTRYSVMYMVCLAGAEFGVPLAALTPSPPASNAALRLTLHFRAGRRWRNRGSQVQIPFVVNPPLFIVSFIGVVFAAVTKHFHGND